ncbi:MAG: hypothetical protein J6T10_03350 [Methanobrevibacter sp.]|nr:hypothetical protein [Methanobrevibacter sp.]
MEYYFNEQENSFFIAANFVPQATPKGFKKITKKKYEELQEELEKQQVQSNEEEK